MSVVRRCTHPSIHFFVSRSQQVFDCARFQAFLCVLCAMCVGASVGVCGGVCAECVCGMCVLCFGVEVCTLCVVLVVWCGAAWHAENLSVCRFKTHPCVRSRRLRVYRENVRVFRTCGRFPGTHGGVLNAHTEAF